MAQTQKHSAGSTARAADPTAPDLARLWACRVLLEAWGRYRGNDRRRGLDPDVCQFVGLEGDNLPTGQEVIRKHLRQQIRRLEPRLRRNWPEPLHSRLSRLADYLHLDDLEQELAALFALCERYRDLQDAFRSAFKDLTAEPLKMLSIALARDPAEIKSALHVNSRLARSGLVRIGGRSSSDIGGTRANFSFSILSGLDSALTSEFETLERFLARYFVRAAPESAQALDFSHCANDRDRMGALIDHALANGERGVNVLIYGAPGVGKTQLVHHLAERHGWELFAVSDTDEDGDPMSGAKRLQGYGLCQFLLDRYERGVLMFDEIEDVFEREWPFFGRRYTSAVTSKGWMNRMLESNPRPVIWIANSVEALHPAYLRRFEYVLRVDVPPRDTRRELLEDSLGSMPVSRQWLAQCAESRDLTPARIQQMGWLARRLQQALPESDLAEALSDQLTQRALLSDPGGRQSGSRRSNPLACYDLGALNTEPAADRLIEGLVRNRGGSVLMHGPPGSGKTAFAEHVAERLGVELEARAASELLDKYLGETEKRLSEMFQKARDNGSVLLLDEADSLLGSRGEAHQRFEVTQTNELLAQMERFDGVFLCATNFFDALDGAVLRRFDVNLEFRHVTADQRRALFAWLADAVGLALPEGAERTRLDQRLGELDNLTPGDFAALARGRRLLPDERDDAEALLAELERQSAHKPGGTRKRIGFV